MTKKEKSTEALLKDLHRASKALCERCIKVSTPMKEVQDILNQSFNSMVNLFSFGLISIFQDDLDESRQALDHFKSKVLDRISGMAEEVDKEKLKFSSPKEMIENMTEEQRKQVPPELLKAAGIKND